MDWYYLDTSFKEAFGRRFEHALPFSEGYAPVYAQERWGYIDTKGQQVVGFKYDAYGHFREGRCLVQNGDAQLCIDTCDNVVFTLSDKPYSSSLEYSSGLAVATSPKCDSWGYIDASGNVALDFKYSLAYQFVNNVAVVRLMNGKYTVISSSGEPLFSTAEKIVEPVNEGRFAAKNKGQWYLHRLNSSERIAVPRTIEITSSFSNSLYAANTVSEPVLHGYIDADTGTWVQKPEYQWCSTFSDGYALVQHDDKYGMIDRRFNEIIRPSYDSMIFHRGSIAVIDEGELSRFYDLTNRRFVGDTYASAFVFSDDYAAVRSSR